MRGGKEALLKLLHENSIAIGKGIFLQNFFKNLGLCNKKAEEMNKKRNKISQNTS